jgi:stage II sporulation protein D
VEITGTAGKAELKNDNVRTVFGNTNIKSMMFSFSGVKAGGAGKTGDTIYIIGAGGKVEKMKLSEVYVYPGILLSETADMPDMPVMDDPDEIVTEGPLIFYGAGYGHGVGVPQDSAIAMAKQGFSYEEILKYFYRGIEIQ